MEPQSAKISEKNSLHHIAAQGLYFAIQVTLKLLQLYKMPGKIFSSFLFSFKIFILKLEKHKKNNGKKVLRRD